MFGLTNPCFEDVAATAYFTSNKNAATLRLRSGQALAAFLLLRPGRDSVQKNGDPGAAYKVFRITVSSECRPEASCASSQIITPPYCLPNFVSLAMVASPT